MVESEKITINMSVVDLGKVDLLVEEGFYANRTDFIRTAIRTLLARHEHEVRESAVRKAMAVGVLIYGRRELEDLRASGTRLTVKIVGLFILGDDVSPELALDTIESIKVSGVFRASRAVREALADRIR